MYCTTIKINNSLDYIIDILTSSITYLKPNSVTDFNTVVETLFNEFYKEYITAVEQNEQVRNEALNISLKSLQSLDMDSLLEEEESLIKDGVLAAIFNTSQALNMLPLLNIPSISRLFNNIEGLSEVKIKPLTPTTINLSDLKDVAVETYQKDENLFDWYELLNVVATELYGDNQQVDYSGIDNDPTEPVRDIKDADDFRSKDKPLDTLATSIDKLVEGTKNDKKLPSAAILDTIINNSDVLTGSLTQIVNLYFSGVTAKLGDKNIDNYFERFVIDGYDTSQLVTEFYIKSANQYIKQVIHRNGQFSVQEGYFDDAEQFKKTSSKPEFYPTPEDFFKTYGGAEILQDTRSKRREEYEIRKNNISKDFKSARVKHFKENKRATVFTGGGFSERINSIFTSTGREAMRLSNEFLQTLHRSLFVGVKSGSTVTSSTIDITNLGNYDVRYTVEQLEKSRRVVIEARKKSGKRSDWFVVGNIDPREEYHSQDFISGLQAVEMASGVKRVELNPKDSDKDNSWLPKFISYDPSTDVLEIKDNILGTAAPIHPIYQDMQRYETSLLDQKSNRKIFLFGRFNEAKPADDGTMKIAGITAEERKQLLENWGDIKQGFNLEDSQAGLKETKNDKGKTIYIVTDEAALDSFIRQPLSIPFATWKKSMKEMGFGVSNPYISGITRFSERIEYTGGRGSRGEGMVFYSPFLKDGEIDAALLDIERENLTEMYALDLSNNSSTETLRRKTTSLNAELDELSTSPRFQEWSRKFGISTLILKTKTVPFSGLAKIVNTLKNATVVKKDKRETPKKAGFVNKNINIAGNPTTFYGGRQISNFMQSFYWHLKLAEALKNLGLPDNTIVKYNILDTLFNPFDRYFATNEKGEIDFTGDNDIIRDPLTDKVKRGNIIRKKYKQASDKILKQGIPPEKILTLDQAGKEFMRPLLEKYATDNNLQVDIDAVFKEGVFIREYSADGRQFNYFVKLTPKSNRVYIGREFSTEYKNFLNNQFESYNKMLPVDRFKYSNAAAVRLYGYPIKHTVIASTIATDPSVSIDRKLDENLAGYKSELPDLEINVNSPDFAKIRVSELEETGSKEKWVATVSNNQTQFTKGQQGGIQSVAFQEYLEWEIENNNLDTRPFEQEWNRGNNKRELAGKYPIKEGRLEIGILYNLVAESITPTALEKVKKAAVRPLLGSMMDFVQEEILEVENTQTDPHMILDGMPRKNGLRDDLGESQESIQDRRAARKAARNQTTQTITDSDKEIESSDQTKQDDLEIDTSDFDDIISFKLYEDSMGEVSYDATVEEVVDKLQSIFGKGFTINSVKTFTSDKTVNSKKLLGYYINKLIHLHEQGGKVNMKVAMHEAFHRVMDLFLTPEEKTKVFNETLKLYLADPATTNTDPDLNVLEEYLADMYMDTYGQYKSKYWSVIKSSGILDLANKVLGKNNFIFKFFNNLRKAYLFLTNRSNVNALLESMDNGLLEYSTEEAAISSLDAPKFKVGGKQEEELMEVTTRLVIAFADPTLTEEMAILASGEVRLQEVTNKMRNRFINKTYFTVDSLSSLSYSPIAILNDIKNDFKKTIEKFNKPQTINALNSKFGLTLKNFVQDMQSLRKSNASKYLEVIEFLSTKIQMDPIVLDSIFVLVAEERKNNILVQSNFTDFVKYEFSDLVDVDLEYSPDLEEATEADQDLGFTIITKDRPGIQHEETVSAKVKRLLSSLTYIDNKGKTVNVNPYTIQDTIMQVFNDVRNTKGVLGNFSVTIEDVYEILKNKIDGFGKNPSSEAYYHHKVLMDYFFKLEEDTSLQQYSLRSIVDSDFYEEFIDTIKTNIINKVNKEFITPLELFQKAAELKNDGSNADQQLIAYEALLDSAKPAHISKVVNELAPLIAKQNAERNKLALNALISAYKSSEFKGFVFPRVNEKSGAIASKVVNANEATILGSLSSAIQSMLDVKTRGVDRFSLTDRALTLIGKKDGVTAGVSVSGGFVISFTKAGTGLQLKFDHATDPTRSRTFNFNDIESDVVADQENKGDEKNERFTISNKKLTDILESFNSGETFNTDEDTKYLSALLNLVGLDMTVETILEFSKDRPENKVKLLKEILLGLVGMHAQYMAITEKMQSDKAPKGVVALQGNLKKKKNSGDVNSLIYKLSLNRNDIEYGQFVGDLKSEDNLTDNEGRLHTGWSPVRDFTNIFTNLLNVYSKIKQAVNKTFVPIGGNNHSLTGLTTTASMAINQLVGLNRFAVEDSESITETDTEKRLQESLKTATPEQVKEIVEGQYKDKKYLVAQTYNNALFRVKLEGGRLVSNVNNGVTKLLKVSSAGIFNHVENNRTGKTKSFSKLSPTELFNQLFNGEFFLGDNQFGTYSNLKGRRMKMFIKNIADRDANFLITHNNKIFYDFEGRDSAEALRIDEMINALMESEDLDAGWGISELEALKAKTGSSLFNLGDQAEAEYMNIYAGQLLYAKNIAIEILEYYNKSDFSGKYVGEALELEIELDSIRGLLEQIKEQEKNYEVYITEYNKLTLSEARLNTALEKLSDNQFDLSELEKQILENKLKAKLEGYQDSKDAISSYLQSARKQLEESLLSGKDVTSLTLTFNDSVQKGIVEFLEESIAEKEQALTTNLFTAQKELEVLTEDLKVKNADLKTLTKTLNTLNKLKEKKVKLNSQLSQQIELDATSSKVQTFSDQLTQIEKEIKEIEKEGITQESLQQGELDIEDTRESITDKRSEIKTLKKTISEEIDKIQGLSSKSSKDVLTALKRINLGSLNMSSEVIETLEKNRKIAQDNLEILNDRIKSDESLTRQISTFKNKLEVVQEKIDKLESKANFKRELAVLYSDRLTLVKEQVKSERETIAKIKQGLTDGVSSERLLPKELKLKNLQRISQLTRVMLNELDSMLITSHKSGHKVVRELTTGKHVNKKRKPVNVEIKGVKRETMLNEVLNQSIFETVDEFMDIQITTLVRGAFELLQTSPDKLKIAKGDNADNDRYNSLLGETLTVGDADVSYTEQRNGYKQYKYFVKEVDKNNVVQYVELTKEGGTKYNSVKDMTNFFKQYEGDGVKPPVKMDLNNNPDVELYAVEIPYNTTRLAPVDFSKEDNNVKRLELLPLLEAEMEYAFTNHVASPFLKQALNAVHPGLIDFLLSYNINTYYVDEFISGSPFQYPGDIHASSIDAVKRFGTAGTPSTKGNWYDPIYNKNAPKTTQTTINVEGLNIDLAEDAQQYFADAFNQIFKFDRDFKDFLKQNKLLNYNQINWKSKQTWNTLKSMRGSHNKIYKYQQFNDIDAKGNKLTIDLDSIFIVQNGNLLIKPSVNLTRQKESKSKLGDYKPLDGISSYSFLFWMQLMSAYGATEGRDTTPKALKMIVDDRNITTQEVLGMKSLQMVLTSSVVYKASDKIKSLLRVSLEMAILPDMIEDVRWSYDFKDTKIPTGKGLRNKTLFDVYMENGGWFPNDSGSFEEVNFSTSGLNVDTGVKVTPSELAVYKEWQKYNETNSFMYLDRLHVNEDGSPIYITEQAFLQEVRINETNASKKAQAIDKYLRDNPSKYSRMEGAGIVNYTDSIKKGGAAFNPLPSKDTNVSALLTSNMSIELMGDIVQLQKAEKADSEMTIPTQFLYNIGVMGGTYRTAQKAYEFLASLSDAQRKKIEKKTAAFRKDLTENMKYEASRIEIKENITKNLDNIYYFAALEPSTTNIVVGDNMFSVSSLESIPTVQRELTAYVTIYNSNVRDAAAKKYNPEGISEISPETTKLIQEEIAKNRIGKLNVKELLVDKLYNQQLDSLAAKRYFRDVIHNSKLMANENDIVAKLTTPDFTDLKELSVSNPILLYSIMGEVAAQYSKGIVLKAHGKKSLQLPAEEFIQLYEVNSGVINDGVRRIYTKEELLKTVIKVKNMTYNDAVREVDRLIKNQSITKRSPKYAYVATVNGKKEIYHSEVVSENPLLPYYKEIMKGKGINEIFTIRGKRGNLSFLADSWNEIDETVNGVLKKLYNEKGELLVKGESVQAFEDSILVKAIKKDKKNKISETMDSLEEKIKRIPKRNILKLREEFEKDLLENKTALEKMLRKLEEKEIVSEKDSKQKKQLETEIDSVDRRVKELENLSDNVLRGQYNIYLENLKSNLEKAVDTVTREDVRKYLTNFNKALYGNMSRIPNTGLNSNSFFKIVGFSSDYGNAVFTPGEWLFISGSDHDGDTLQMWMYDPSGKNKNSDITLDITREVMTNPDNIVLIFSELDEAMKPIQDRSSAKFEAKIKNLRSGDYYSWIEIHQQNAIGKLGVGAMAILGKHYAYTAQALKKMADFIVMEKAFLNKSLERGAKKALQARVESDLLGFTDRNVKNSNYTRKGAINTVLTVSNLIGSYIKLKDGKISVRDIIEGQTRIVNKQKVYLREQFLTELSLNSNLKEDLDKLQEYLKEYDKEMSQGNGTVASNMDSYLAIEELIDNLVDRAGVYDSSIDLEALNEKYPTYLKANGNVDFFKSDLKTKSTSETEIQLIIEQLESLNKSNVNSLIALTKNDSINLLKTKDFNVKIADDLDAQGQAIRKWIESLIQSAVDNAKHMALGASGISLDNADMQSAMTFLGLPSSFIMDIFTRKEISDIFKRYKDANDLKNEYGKDLKSFFAAELKDQNFEVTAEYNSLEVFDEDYLTRSGVKSIVNGEVVINSDKIDLLFTLKVLYGLTTFAEDYSELAGAMAPTYGIKGKQEDGDAQLDKILTAYGTATVETLDNLIDEIETLEKNNVAIYMHPRIYNKLVDLDIKSPFNRVFYEGDIMPEPDTVFVFESNLAGNINNLAARQAVAAFGVDPLESVSNKLSNSGQAFGLLTFEKAGAKKSFTSDDIINSIKELYKVAQANPNKKFKVAYKKTTEALVNGYTGLEMIEMFNQAGAAPSNIIFSKEWVKTRKLLKDPAFADTDINKSNLVAKKLVQANLVGLSFPHVRKMLKSHLLFHKNKQQTHALYSPVMTRLRNVVNSFTDKTALRKGFNRGKLLTAVYQTIYSKFLKTQDDYNSYQVYKIDNETNKLVVDGVVKLDTPQALFEFKKYLEQLVGQINATSNLELNFINRLSIINGEIYLSGGETIKPDSPESKQLMASFASLEQDLQKQLFQYLLVNKRYGLAHKKGSYYKFISDSEHKAMDRFLSENLEENKHLYFGHTNEGGKFDPDELLELVTMWYVIDNPSVVKDSSQKNYVRETNSTTYSTRFTSKEFNSRDAFDDILEVKTEIGKDKNKVDLLSPDYYRLSEYSMKEKRGKILQNKKGSVETAKTLTEQLNKVVKELNPFKDFQQEVNVIKGQIYQAALTGNNLDPDNLTEAESNLLTQTVKREATGSVIMNQLEMKLNQLDEKEVKDNDIVFKYGDQMDSIFSKDAYYTTKKLVHFKEEHFKSSYTLEELKELGVFIEIEEEVLKEYLPILNVILEEVVANRLLKEQRLNKLAKFKEIKNEIYKKVATDLQMELTEADFSEDTSSVKLPPFLRIPIYTENQPTVHQIWKLERLFSKDEAGTETSQMIYRRIWNPAVGLDIVLTGDIEYKIEGKVVKQKDMFFVNPNKPLQEGQFRYNNTGGVEGVKEQTKKSEEGKKEDGELHKLRRFENMSLPQRMRSQTRLKLLGRILKKVFGVTIKYVEPKQMPNPNSVGYVSNGVIYLNMQQATYKDLLHEMGHILLPMISKNLDLRVYETPEVIEAINRKIEEYKGFQRDISYTEARWEVLSDNLMNRMDLTLTKLLWENVKIELAKMLGVSVNIKTIDDLLQQAVKVLDVDQLSDREQQEIVSLLASNKTITTDVKSNIQFECL